MFWTGLHEALYLNVCKLFFSPGNYLIIFICNTFNANIEYKAPNAVLAAVVCGTVGSGEKCSILYKSVARVAVYGGEASILEEGIDWNFFCLRGDTYLLFLVFLEFGCFFLLFFFLVLVLF